MSDALRVLLVMLSTFVKLRFPTRPFPFGVQTIEIGSFETTFISDLDQCFEFGHPNDCGVHHDLLCDWLFILDS